MKRIVARLNGVKAAPNGFVARCPAHKDTNPSLSISESGDGTVLLYCHAGCEFEAITSALGMTPADLFPDGSFKRGGGPPLHDQGGATTQSAGCTLEAYAIEKGLSIDWLKDLGLTEIWLQGSPALRIPYCDSHGKECAVRHRIALHGTERFRWKQRSKPFLYGLNRLPKRQEQIVLVEGESDCHTLWFHKIPAVGVPGANTWNEGRDAPLLAGFERIYVVLEADAGGEAVQKWLERSSIRDRVEIIKLEGFKDPSAMHVASPERFMERWSAAIEQAIPWNDTDQLRQQEEYRSARDETKGLASHPDIGAEFAAAVERAGLVNEDKNAQLLLLALTSRVLPRPVSVVVKGPSSGGKSYLVETVLGFVPDSAYEDYTAMSERFLLYDDTDIRNKFIVFYEVDGIHGDMAEYGIRSLLSEGRLRYGSVQRGEGGFATVQHDREGPTGLIMTTTRASLHAENETRFLSLRVTDSKKQTKEIMRRLANPSEIEEDPSPWLALQRMIECGKHAVVIPFAPAVVELIPEAACAIRIRRDVTLLLHLVKASALLHQETRLRDEDGAIVASLDDYRVVRDLVDETLSAGLRSTVPRTIRETVEIVARLAEPGKPATIGDIATALNLDRSTAYRRCLDAAESGFVHNREDRRSRPGEWVLGDPMPDDVTALPSVEAVEAYSKVGPGCTIAHESGSISPPLQRGEDGAVL